MKIAYLGPEGTFTEQAAIRFAESMARREAALSPVASIEDVFGAVEAGTADYGAVPVENSIEGAVNTTIDTLIFDSELSIAKQLSLPIVQNMMVNAKNAGSRIAKIISHQQALAQCRKFINATYPGAVIETAGSTAEAAGLAACCNAENGGATAAIGSGNSAQIHGLKIIHDNIQDNKNNTTQFILLTREDTSAPKPGYNTSITFSTRHKPGELYRILDIFSIWDLNMTKIMSRPAKSVQGEYRFFVELEGCGNVSDMLDALTMVKRKASFFKNLGSYQTIGITEKYC